MDRYDSDSDDTEIEAPSLRPRHSGSSRRVSIFSLYDVSDFYIMTFKHIFSHNALVWIVTKYLIKIRLFVQFTLQASAFILQLFCTKKLCIILTIRNTLIYLYFRNFV